MNMGATLFRMTPAECLTGHAAGAAAALGLADRGTLAPDMRADLARSGTPNTRPKLTYRIGFNPLHARIVGGEFV